MSYEICVFDAGLVTTKEAACEAWNKETYYGASLPRADRSAQKWRTRDALKAFNPKLTFTDFEKTRKGFVAEVLGSNPRENHWLLADLNTRGAVTNFCILDHAVDIQLAWDAGAGQAKHVVHDVWRHLEALSRMGFSTIYDAERDALLDLESDLDVVLKGYVEMLNLDIAFGAANAFDAAAQTKSPLATGFAGNDGASRRWWKFW
jgi:hypothetical protein